MVNQATDSTHKVKYVLKLKYLLNFKGKLPQILFFNNNGNFFVRSRWSTLEELEYQVRVEKSRLIAMSSHEPSQFNSNEWKVDNFYQVASINHV